MGGKQTLALAVFANALRHAAEHFNWGSEKMKSWVAYIIGLVSVATGACGSPVSGHPSATDSSISPEEMAIYETVLAPWLGKEKGRQLVNAQLSGPPSKDDPDI